MRYLLDTNVCIAVLRGVTKATERISKVAPDDCGVSTITLYELATGVERCREPDREWQKVERFLEPLHLLSFDEMSARSAARVRWQLERAGTPIGPYDTQLAGQALALDVKLVTRNLSEFKRVEGLNLENWE